MMAKKSQKPSDYEVVELISVVLSTMTHTSISIYFKDHFNVFPPVARG